MVSMKIHKEMPMAELIRLNYQLLPVISRLHIPLGFGNKTIEEVCMQSGVETSFFLMVVNSFHDKDYIPCCDELQAYPIASLINYLQSTHAYYLREKLPFMEQLIEKFLDDIAHGNKEKSAMVNLFFREYRDELIAHIEYEENVVLPYVGRIGGVTVAEGPVTVKNDNTGTYSIDRFAREHSNVEDKVNDLINLIIKFMPPVHKPSVANDLLMELFRFARDIENHARIEDKVLVPRVQAIEEQLTR